MSEPRDRTRLWIWADRLVIPAALVWISVAGNRGVEPWIILVVLGLGGFGITSLVLDPDRPWWGPGPRRYIERRDGSFTADDAIGIAMIVITLILVVGWVPMGTR